MGSFAPNTTRCQIELPGAGRHPVTLCVERHGTGRPVVFVHGLIGRNEHWHPVLPGVETDAECTLLEIPLLELDAETASVSGVLGLLDAYLREHLAEPAVLVGSSFGGHVATRFALEHPDRVAALVLTGSSGAMERDILSTTRVPRQDREWLASRVGDLFYDRTLVDGSDVARVQSLIGNRSAARSFLRLSRSALNDYIGSELSEIHCPTLLVWGRQDVVTPPEAAEIFHREISGSRLVWIDECGHAPMIEKPREFAEALAKFLATLD